MFENLCRVLVERFIDAGGRGLGQRDPRRWSTRQAANTTRREETRLGLLHKTEVAGVHLEVQDAAGLRVALEALAAAGVTRGLVEKMVAPRVDLIVGARRDPPSAPLRCRTRRRRRRGPWRGEQAPMRWDDAEAMVDGLPAQPLLDGFRGSPPVDRGELARAIVTVADVLLAHETLRDVEVNPLRTSAVGLIALDALLVTRPGPGRTR